MRESTPADTGSPTPVEASVETQQRFHRLRVLIHDDRRRQRLLFMLSLLALAIVSFMAFLTSQLQNLQLNLIWHLIRAMIQSRLSFSLLRRVDALRMSRT